MLIKCITNRHHISNTKIIYKIVTQTDIKWHKTAKPDNKTRHCVRQNALARSLRNTL